MEVVVINGSITDQEEVYYINFIKLYEPNCHRLEVIVKDDRTVHLVPHTKLPIYANISRPSTVTRVEHNKASSDYLAALEAVINK